MGIQIFMWLNNYYPRNYIIEKHFTGTLFFLAFSLGFILLYKPLNVHEARSFGFPLTMVIYLCALFVPVFFSIKLLKNIRYFSNPDEWTIVKEIISIAIILSAMGIALYFYGFLFEIPAQRWNLPTFLDSIEHAFLVGIIPFMFFTSVNYRHLFTADSIINFNPVNNSLTTEQSEELVRIGSQLKKEELNIYPSQFIYAESDGNYVVFYIHSDNQVRKKMIRNSISSIEQQLSEIPFLMRIHRAFIVNVKQVVSQKGNTLGYRLKLNGIEPTIPVSRQNTREFDQLLKKYR